MRGIRHFLTLFFLACVAFPASAQDALPSWRDGPAKAAILTFVTKATTSGGPDFIPEPERIATFDNDGTLWSEQPMYFQAFFAFDRIRRLAPQHPEWQATEPYRSALADDMKGLAESGEKGLVELIAATHTGLDTEQFNAVVADWIATAKHPTTGKPYTAMVFQPMLELLAYLRANGFKTYIVSGGGQEFMRAWAEKVYGIPPEQVIGSQGDLKYEMRDGAPVLTKEAKVVLVDDGAGKPVGIHRVIGRRPVFAFGNSDGDRQMLEWTRAGTGLRFAGLVHHDDGKREWAYDRDSKIGKLDVAWDQAIKDGWIVVSMAKDWRVIHPDAP